MKDEIERWHQKLWVTKGARFVAAKRYELHDKWSTITISLVSVYIIIINLLVLIPDRPCYLSEELITFSTISLSILVIVISIIVNNMNYKHLAHKFHDCGREITVVYDKVCLLRTNIGSISKTDIQEISEEYNSIIKNYDINHSNLDLLVFKKDYPEEFNIDYPFWFKMKVLTKYSYDTIGRYFIFILLPFLIYALLM
ncbi:MAG: SLATT domain-containing protein [Flagellimonas sp.]